MSRIFNITWAVYSSIAEDAKGEQYQQFKGKVLCTPFQDEFEARQFFEQRLLAMKRSEGNIADVRLEAGIVYKHQTIKAVS